jgi:hypothetical protein
MIIETKLEELLQKGKSYNFKNNSQKTNVGTFSKASDELLGWTAIVEEFIKENYGENSGPYKLYETFNRRYLTGYEEDDFNNQLAKILGALYACKEISPRLRPKSKIKDENQIISLIKNPYFWAAIVVLMGASFTLGFYFGSSKFDKEKSEYYEGNKQLRLEIENKKQILIAKDSLINVYQTRIKEFEEN